MGIFDRLFGSRGWNRFPQTFVVGIQRRLGEELFQTLTMLAEKYDLFGQPLFARLQHQDIEEELTITRVVGLLTIMGNELTKHQLVEDAEKIFNIALCLLPECSSALGGLAIIYYCTGRTDKAREHAARAVAEMEKARERFKHIPVREDIAQQDDVDYFRNILARMANGEAVELDW